MDLRYKLVYRAYRLDEGKKAYYRYAATRERIEEIAQEIKLALNPMHLEIIDTQPELEVREEISMIEKSERFARLINALMGEYPQSAIDEPTLEEISMIDQVNIAPRQDLTPTQVSELLIQIDTFTDIANQSFADNDLDRCETASVWAIGLTKLIG